jgi:hypothetical protein
MKSQRSHKLGGWQGAHSAPRRLIKHHHFRNKNIDCLDVLQPTSLRQTTKSSLVRGNNVRLGQK